MSDQKDSDCGFAKRKDAQEFCDNFYGELCKTLSSKEILPGMDEPHPDVSFSISATSKVHGI